MSDEVFDLSVQRTVKGASGTVFTCRKQTNDVTAERRVAERNAEEVVRRIGEQQKRFQKTERDEDGEERVIVTNSERWEALEAEACDALLAQLIPVLLHEDGTVPDLDRLRREFGVVDIQWVIEHARRPTVPGWATTTLVSA